MPRTPHLLAIQSHVVFGHAGNAAAVFPMQRIGINVWPLNTVQFSNHTQYGQWTGQVLPPEQIPALVDGIAGIGELGNCDAVLSGYLAAPPRAAPFSTWWHGSNRPTLGRCTSATRSWATRKKAASWPRKSATSCWKKPPRSPTTCAPTS